MQYQTKELNIVVHSNNIMELTATETSKGILTLEEVENNLAAFKQATNGKTMAALLNISGSYTKKEVLKKYSNLDYGIIATALVANSFTSKFIGNIFLAMVQRFSEDMNNPTKIFTDKETAVEWLLMHLEKAK